MSDKKQEVFKTEKRFYSDIPADLHGVFLRATIYCGEILSLRVPELPDGYSFFSAKDVPKDKTITIGEETIPLFAEDRVSFFGQPIGILVGEDKFVLQSLLQEFRIEYKEESLVYFPSIKEQSDGDILKNFYDFHNDGFVLQQEKSHGSETVLEECLQEEKEFCYSLTLPETFPERIGCIASLKKGSIHIYAPIRWLSLTEKLIEKVTGLPSKKIILHSTVCHHLPANSLFEIPILCTQLAVAALVKKGTVKFESSGFEHSAFFARRMNAIVGIKTSIEETGKITGMKLWILLDIGHINPCINTILSRVILEACGPFAIPNYNIQIFTQRTNYSSSDVNPRSLFALLTMALNRHFHEKSMELGTENFFLKNAILSSHEKMEGEKLPTIFANVLDKSDYKRKNSAYKNITAMNNLSLPIRGISYAVGFENIGGFDSSEGKKFYTMEVTMATDNNVIIKFHRIKSEIKAAWCKIVADFFNLQPSQIIFDESFSDKNFSLVCEIFP
ncbi:MAG: molybdopterin-dependent oxidoreductase, partial [Spirochaetaceae bacterium]|nr:molybdopterin-dependent oxidoreductase [Spirochaetaceae bacterium]